MTADMFHIDNRRSFPRVQAQATISVEDRELGYTLDVSLGGARILSRQPLGERFPLLLKLEPEGLALEAECVWSQPLGSPGLTVAGVRFKPTARQQRTLEHWMQGKKRAS